MVVKDNAGFVEWSGLIAPSGQDFVDSEDEDAFSKQSVLHIRGREIPLSDSMPLKNPTKQIDPLYILCNSPSLSNPDRSRYEGRLSAILEVPSFRWPILRRRFCFCWRQSETIEFHGPSLERRYGIHQKVLRKDH